MGDRSQHRSVQNMGGDTCLSDAAEGTSIGEAYHARQDIGLRPHKRLAHRRKPHQGSWTYVNMSPNRGVPSQVEGVSSGESGGHARKLSFPVAVLEDDLPAVGITTPLDIQRNPTGLPPTPPMTTDNSNLGLQAASLPSDPQFADVIRSVLDPHNSNYRLSTPAAHLAPHTPDPSPPSDLTVERVSHLRPDALKKHPSSRADSYHTACETQSANRLRDMQSESRSASQSRSVHQEQDGQFQHSLYTSKLLHGQSQTAAREVHHTYIEDLISNILQKQHIGEHSSEGNSSPGPRQYQLGDSSSTECSESPSISLKQSNLSSECSGEVVLDRANVLLEPADTAHQHRHNHIGPRPDVYHARGSPNLFPPLPSTERHVSAEDVNNLVYQHIQQANVRKHGLAESLAMPVGIIAMRDDKHHTLKRTTKCLSLRGTASDGSPRTSIGSSLPQLQYAKPSMHSSPTRKNHKLLPGRDAPRHVSSPLPATFTQPYTHGYEVSKPLAQMEERQHTLRRSRKIDRFEAPSFTSPALSSDGSGTPQKPSLPSWPTQSTGPTLRRSSREHKLQSLSPPRSMVEEPYSPRRKDFDMRLLHTTPTPMSQFSDRTEVEVLEARGVSIFPHNNQSLVMLQNGTRPSSKDDTTPEQANVSAASTHIDDPLNRKSPQGWPDSLLTHPRSGPEPPMVAVIPPTPNDELDSMVDTEHTHKHAKAKPQTQPGLFQRARRYSEGVIQPLFGRSLSSRKQPLNRSSTADDERPTNLSPFWRPRYFWEDVDSDDEYDEYGDVDLYYEEPPQHILPRGGDTSNVVETRRVFPRNMSVRMPGFHGNGGFLVGNSLGLDRHGSNNRRPHIARRRASEEMLRHVSKDWIFTLPFPGTKRLRNVGLTRWRRRLIDRNHYKQEREYERRCQVLKDQIQH